MTDTKAIAEAIKKAADGLDGAKIYLSADWGTGDITLRGVVPMEKKEHGGPVMRCPDCGWTEQEGAPWGDSGMLYDVFLVDGPFGDEDAPLVRLNEVDCLELGTLLRIAMRQDFDMVVRRGEESEE